MSLRRPSADDDPGVPGGAGEARLHLRGGRGDGDRAARRVTSWITPGSSWARARRSSGRPGPPWGGGSSSAWAGWRRGRRRRRSRPARSWRSWPGCLGLWWLNACRIVYVVDEAGPVTRFGFAYGTLPGHAGSGRGAVPRRVGPGERRRSGTTSWPSPARTHFLTRLGYPYMRRVQKRFGRESAAAMVRAVKGEG